MAQIGIRILLRQLSLIHDHALSPVQILPVIQRLTGAAEFPLHLFLMAVIIQGDLHRRHQRILVHRFYDIPHYVHVHRLIRDLLVPVSRQDHHKACQLILMDHPRCLKPGHHRHIHIHDHKIRMLLLADRDGIQSILCLSHYLKSVILQNLPNIHPDQNLIICNHYFIHALPPTSF